MILFKPVTHCPVELRDKLLSKALELNQLKPLKLLLMTKAKRKKEQSLQFGSNLKALSIKTLRFALEVPAGYL